MKKYLVYIVLIACGMFALNRYANSFGELNIENAWARAAQGSTTAVYMDIINATTADQNVVLCHSPICDKIEIHETITHTIGGQEIFKMQPMEKLLIPSKNSVSLKPMDKHFMLIGLHQALRISDKIDFYMQFENETKHVVITVGNKSPSSPCSCAHKSE